MNELPFAAELALKSVVLVAFVGLVTLTLRRASAAVRHGVWALGFGLLALLPVLVSRVPAIEVSRPIVVTPAPMMIAPTVPAPRPIPRTSRLTPAAVTPATAAESASVPTPFPWTLVCESVWAVGTALALLRTTVCLVRARSVAKKATPTDLPAREGVLRDLNLRLELRRSDEVDVPMTLGLFRPVVLLPEGVDAWPEETQRAVLLHEGAHVRRRDWAWLIFARFVGAVYWWNPLVHWAAARMRAESEVAADDMVVLAGVSGARYAEELLRLAMGVRSGQTPGYAIPVVGKGTLKPRIAEILRSAKRRNPLAFRTRLVLSLLGLGIVAPFAAARLVPGPATVTDGSYDLGKGHRISIVAITEMNGNVARSWNVRGEILPEPFPINRATQEALRLGWPGQVGNPKTARYVIVRTDLQGDIGLKFTLPGAKEPLPSAFYSYVTFPKYGKTQEDRAFEIGDLANGIFTVVRLDAKASARADLEAWAPNENWRSYATASYAGGKLTGTTKPDFHPAFGSDTALRFTIPAAFSDQQAILDVEGQPARYALEPGVVGPQTYAGIATKPAELTKIELLHRTVRHVVFRDLPMLPRPNAQYTPPTLRLPGEVAIAKGNVARLSDGTSLVLAGVSNDDRPNPRLNADALDTRSANFGSRFSKTHASIRGWTINGRSIVNLPNYKDFLQSIVLPSNYRKVYLYFNRTHKSVNDQFTLAELFDESGWKLKDFTSVEVLGPQGDDLVYGIVLPKSRPSIGLILRLSLGKYRTVLRAPLSGPGRYPSRYLPGKGKEPGSLEVTFPAGFWLGLKDEESSIDLYDAKGKEVRMGRLGYEYDNDLQRRFPLTREQAARVRTVVVKARPYHWARFSNVSLYPR